jgi:hypothetical protein
VEKRAYQEELWTEIKARHKGMRADQEEMKATIRGNHLKIETAVNCIWSQLERTINIGWKSEELHFWSKEHRSPQKQHGASSKHS